MVQYYTLEQAAQVLQTTPDKVKEMARKNEVRSFQDRGNLRFRAPEIDELARSRGLGSDPALTPTAEPKSPPPSSPRRKSKIPPQEPIAFVDDDEAPIGREPPASSKSKLSSSGGKSGSSGKVARRPTMSQPGPKSPPPRAASDSDVRLVAEGSDLDFQVVPEEPKSPAPGASSPTAKPGSGARKGGRSSKLGKADSGDSGVRFVPLDESDSDVKIEPDSSGDESALAGPRSGKRPIGPESGVGESALAGHGSGKKKKPSDSEIRLDDYSKEVKGKRPGDHPITEEIDLDAEQQRADAAARTQGGQGRSRPKANPLNLPTSSPFELSEGDIDMDEPPRKAPRPSKVVKPSKAPEPVGKVDDTESSSDFELTPIGGADASPLDPGSSEVEALAPDDSDEVSLGELTGAGAAQSGINLQDPADSGISLEQGGSDEIEFELSLDAGATPKPGPVKQDESSSEFELAVGGGEADAAAESSEFELALEGDDAPAGEEESSSEFELSLEPEGSSETEAAPGDEPDSDSEFELTLDADGGLEESGGGDALAGGDEEKDIFETDFEVPALEDEESGSEAVVLEDEDTDLETSDFDLALDEEGGEEDAESGSQVVTLDDDEEVDEGAETEARPRRRRAAADEDEESELDLEIDPNAETEEEEEEEPVAAGAAPAAAVPWGPLPALLMIPTVLVMFVVGLLAFELAGTMWNYHQPGRTTGFGIVLHPVAKYFDPTLPD